MVLKNSSSTKAGTTEGNSREDSLQNGTPNRREFKLQKIDRCLESMDKNDNYQDLYNLLDIDLQEKEEAQNLKLLSESMKLQKIIDKFRENEQKLLSQQSG